MDVDCYSLKEKTEMPSLPDDYISKECVHILEEDPPELCEHTHKGVNEGIAIVGSLVFVYFFLVTAPLREGNGPWSVVGWNKQPFL